MSNDETSESTPVVNPPSSSTSPNVALKAHGEVAGSFLLGLVQSFYNLNALPQGGLNFDLGQIDPEGWYPHALLIDALSSIREAIPASDSLFFQAGVHFLRIWYEHGPGKSMIHSTLDWLHANDESGGYNTVVRGGTKDEIGWCRVQSIDEQAGIAVIENVMPLTVEYVKGVFYGGCLIFDDLDYVSVEGRSEPYDGNPTFNKFYITVRFRLKPKVVARDLDECLKTLHTGSPLSLNAEEFERLAWRYQWIQYQRDLDARYFNDINVVLAQATLESQRVTRELAASQAELKVINEELEVRVADRTAELETTLQRLRESQQSLANSEARATMSTMIAGLSHELSTPLGNSLMANSTIADSTREFQALMTNVGLKRIDMTNFVGVVDQGVGMVESNLLRANELLKNFRQVAADQASEQRRNFDVAQVVKEVVHTMGPSLKRYTHRVVIDIEPGIEMDSQPGPLGQIVINLINNAYLHAFEGVAKGVLTIEAKSDGGWVDMYVRDNGIGIPTENLEKLFQAFFSTKIGKGGTGLGMAIVQNLVTKTLCGSVDVQSTVGEGTEFRIRLPRVLPMEVTAS